MKIRTALPGEAMQIAGLVNRAYRPQAGPRGWTDETGLVAGARTSAAQVRGLLDGTGTVLVAQDGSGIVACVHVEPGPGLCRIGMLATEPARQGQGLGQALLAAAQALAVQRFGARRLVMHVLSSRPALLAYYERRGYRLTGQVSPYPLHAGVGQPLSPGLQVLELAKPLGPGLGLDGGEPGGQ